MSTKVALQPSDQHPSVLVHFQKEPYLHSGETTEETRFPTGEARLNNSNESLVCRNNAAHTIGQGAYYTVEIDEPVCFQCRPFTIGAPKHKAGNPFGLSK